MMFVLFSLFPFGALAAGVNAFHNQFELRAALLPLSIPLFVSLAGLTYVGRVRRRRWSTAPLRVSTPAESSVPGLVIPYSRSYSTWVVALIVSLTGASLPLGIYAANRFSTGARAGGIAYGVLAVGLLANIGFIVEILRKRIVRGAVLLTPEGIVHRSWSSEASCAWGAVRRIQPVAVPATSIRVTNTVIPGDTSHRFVQRTPMLRPLEAKHRPDLILYTPFLSIDPVLVLETMRFYAANPLLRHELGTQTAIDRVRRGDVLQPGA